MEKAAQQWVAFFLVVWSDGLSQHVENLERRILQYQESLCDTKNDTVNIAVKVEDTLSRLIAAVKEHPEYMYDEYAEALGVGGATALNKSAVFFGVERIICLDFCENRQIICLDNFD